jgi:hypothetical protein
MAAPCYHWSKAQGENSEKNMKTKFTYYQEDDMWVGWLEDYPDYRTQGESLSELKENLKDIYHELTSGNIPGVRKVGELVLK